MLNRLAHIRIKNLYKEYQRLASWDELDELDNLDGLLLRLGHSCPLYGIVKQMAVEYHMIDRIQWDRLMSCRIWKKNNPSKRAWRVSGWKRRIKKLKEQNGSDR